MEKEFEVEIKVNISYINNVQKEYAIKSEFNSLHQEILRFKIIFHFQFF